MLLDEQRCRVSVVLVGARNPGNIGAAARAMHDFGFSDLRFVNEYTGAIEAAPLHLGGEADKAAVGAGEVLAGASTYATVADAVADCNIVAGTTAVGERAIEQPLLPLKEAVAAMLVNLQTNATDRAALLFGSEKTGLTKDQLSHCNMLLTIPMYQPAGARHLSMNLGQSVAVCLYEFSRSGLEGARPIVPHSEQPATAADRERLTQLLLDVMHATGYSRRFPANAQEPLVRRLALTAGESHAEAETWMGILRQVLWSARGVTQRDDKTKPLA